MASVPRLPRPVIDSPPDAVSLDVLIVGGGVCGTALLFELARYTDLGHIALVERYDQLARVNSRATNNSQTIHCGDIETNYTLEKALAVKRTAEMIVRYAELLEPAQRRRCVFQTPKMVLAVGEAECALLRERFERFSPHFPAMELLEKEQIAAWEPAVALVDGQLRPEELVAIGICNTATAVDYEELAASFVQQAQEVVTASRGPGGGARRLDLHMGTSVAQITPEGERFRVSLAPTPGQQQGVNADGTPVAPRAILARHVVVNAGAHSLLMAQRMGFGQQYSCLPVAGSFYFTPDLLRGKVYTVQNDKLPFAAIHGDPDVRAAGKTRFGPTALLLPLLERYRPASFWEFLQVLRLDWAVLGVFWQLLRVADIRNYILKNLLFEVPWLRRRLFLADARKIVPGMRLEDLRFAEGYGGVRPQLIDKANRRLMLGEASIPALPGLVFNVTPSPGGTCCLGNAARDLAAIVERLGCAFDRQRLARELYGEDSAGSALADGGIAQAVAAEAEPAA
ncbi:MAG: FAD-dependent oxidoreductase [Cyanobium sp. PLM2.Bin73]|nr:MAG: FAD-dependent oxidoreductase [Cyanobium sp. PLM2.Bin73]